MLSSLRTALYMAARSLPGSLPSSWFGIGKIDDRPHVTTIPRLVSDGPTRGATAAHWLTSSPTDPGGHSVQPVRLFALVIGCRDGCGRVGRQVPREDVEEVLKVVSALGFGRVVAGRYFELRLPQSQFPGGEIELAPRCILDLAQLRQEVLVLRNPTCGSPRKIFLISASSLISND